MRARHTSRTLHRTIHSQPNNAHHNHTRPFSSTANRLRNGAVPIFHPSPSETLNQLLNSIRTKVILPAHLKRPQQNLIYRTQHHAMLRSEPFEVDVGPPGATEKFTLEPIDRTKDVPNSWKSLQEAMRLMGEGTREGGRGYDNLIPLLTGLRTAGRKWKTWQWEIIARTAGAHDAAYALLEAVRQADRTGLYLYDIRVVREIVWACRARAALHEWDAVSCAKALGYLEELARLMEDPDQKREQTRALNRGDLDVPIDATRQADTIGVVVEVAAMRLRALQQEGGESALVDEVRNTLQRYVKRLLPNMEMAVDEEKKAIDAGKPLAMVADYELLRWVPVLHGLVGAEDMREFAQEEGKVKKHIEALQQKIRDLRDTIVERVGGDEGGKRRGLVECRKLNIA